MSQDMIGEAWDLVDMIDQWSPGMRITENGAVGNDPTQEQLTYLRHFMKRPWRGSPCSLDDICLYAAKVRMDPEPLMRLARFTGEWDPPYELHKPD